jgi:membrane protease YdiL (CAAX protease family)
VTPRRLWAGIAGYWTAGAAVVVTVGAGPAAAWPSALAAATGIAAGIGLFALFARRLPPRLVLPPSLLVVLVLSAAAEELVWRRLVVRELAARASVPAALVGSACLFAFAHGRLRLARLAGGGAFGLLYVAAGGLLAPVCAHAVYNVAVAGAVGPRRRPLGASP